VRPFSVQYHWLTAQCVLGGNGTPGLDSLNHVGAWSNP
jgi:hypothetical protein